MKDPVQERNEVLYRLELAVNHLEASMSPLLIKDDRSTLAYAVRGARDGNGVAAVPGGMVLVDGKVTRSAPCAFGADEDAARIVLTAIKCDPLMRSAAILRFSEKVLAVFEAMLLECTPIRIASNAPAISTMDWRVASCCNDGVPDIIYDPGGNKNSGFLYIFGEDPIVVANNIIICSNRI
ncbi:MAG: phosphomethylpyrimidine kinase [Methanomicrobiales archaeon HGW-Methanomicrobiales-5]|nr:MAG: phosphomethylpyrimidine kinase [Methanomicrobiales archaeon HGW-Methanomicrobiales-5]